MIRDLGQLLEALRQEETKRLDASDIKHGPTIGAMYEGLTRELLGKAIPPELDLRIVSGFVIDGLGGTTGQLDCMLVRGEGIPVPYVADTFQWHVKDVLAVIEIKKTLGTSDLSDAFEQLKNVVNTYSAWLQAPSTKGTVSVAASYRAYAECTGETVPEAEKRKDMQVTKQLILHVIETDQLAPVRIILGYHGYKTENGLRRGLVDFLEEKLNTHGYGPAQLPNLIVANTVSLIKLSGHPYRAKLDEDGYWPIIASSHVNPTLLILELLWTRISYMHSVSEVWGDDLQIEMMSRLLDARPEYDEKLGTGGWRYKHFKLKPKQLAGEAHIDWQPEVLDEDQHTVVNILCQRDIPIDEPELLLFLDKAGKQPQAFIKSLVDTGLVAVKEKKLVLTTTVLQALIMPDGRIVAADNNTGRLTRWWEKERARAEKANSAG